MFICLYPPPPPLSPILQEEEEEEEEEEPSNEPGIADEAKVKEKLREGRKAG